MIKFLRYAIFFTLLLTTSLFSTYEAFANSYVGGYPSTNVYYQVSKIWMDTNYSASTPSQINCLIKDVESTAGGSGSDRTGWTYQIVSFLQGVHITGCNSYTQGEVYTDPQVWYGLTEEWELTTLQDIGSYNSISYSEQSAEWQSGQVNFQYTTHYTDGSSSLYGFQYNPSSYSDPSSHFMTGNTTHNNGNVKFLQFGVESYADNTNPIGWNITQYNVGFHNAAAGNDVYLNTLSNYVTQGDKSFITWIGTTNYVVGGTSFPYAGVAASPGYVDWFYNSTNSNDIADNSPLWRICSPPPSGDWNVASSCWLLSSSTPPANVIIQNSAVLKIRNALSLAIDFIHYHLLVNPGSGILIYPGGKIT